MELLCTEGDTIKRAYPDRVFLKDDRVLQNQLRIEEFYAISPRFMQQQDDIKPYMRKIVAQWMLEVCTIDYTKIPAQKSQGLPQSAINFRRYINDKIITTFVYQS